MVKRLAGLLAGMLVTVIVYAAGVQLRTDHPDSYTVRKGDTLWDISARFLAKPWLWPEIWQANPQVANPHLIYPGDVLDLSFAEGPQLKLEPQVRSEPDAPVAAIPLADLGMFLKDLKVVDSGTLRDAPYVVGFEEARLHGTVGGNLYVRGLRTEPGQRWAIVRPGHVFRGFGHDDERELVAHPLDSDVALVSSPWSEDSRGDGHYGRGHDHGVEVGVIGTAEVLRTGDPTTLLLLDASQEIQKGDRIVPLDDKPYDASFYPHAPKAVPSGAEVIAFADGLAAVGSRQVVALSIGARDGVENGQTYGIYQPGESIHDDVAGDSWRRGVGQDVTLPQEFAGHVMVFRTFDEVSYGLVMDGIKPVRLHDKLALPE